MKDKGLKERYEEIVLYNGPREFPVSFLIVKLELKMVFYLLWVKMEEKCKDKIIRKKIFQQGSTKKNKKNVKRIKIYSTDKEMLT